MRSNFENWPDVFPLVPTKAHVAILALWKGGRLLPLHNRPSLPAIFQNVAAIMDALKTFMERTQGLSYKPKSIFPSEMFLFYMEALKVNPDLIIESGVGYGGSTRYLTKLFPNEAPEIIAIDDERYKKPGVKSRLRWRVMFIPGDSLEVMPALVSKTEAKRIVILIDGPKGQAAVDLATQMLATDKVWFVAVHDLAFDCPGKYRVQSHEPDFRQAFGFLDKGTVPDRQLHKQPNGPGLTIFKPVEGTFAKCLTL